LCEGNPAWSTPQIAFVRQFCHVFNLETGIVWWRSVTLVLYVDTSAMILDARLNVQASVSFAAVARVPTAITWQRESAAGESTYQQDYA
jgi:hypothetical protein